MNFYLLFVLLSPSYAINFNCLKGPEYWCASVDNAKECYRIVECFSENINRGVVTMSRVKSDGSCELCKQIVTDLEANFIPHSFTEPQLVDYIDLNVCNKLSDDYQALCKTLVAEYGPQIYKELIELLKPENMCLLLRLCGNGTAVPMGAGTPGTCALCKEVVDTLHSLLQKVSSADIVVVLELVVCDQLPPGLRTLCRTIVNAYTDELYEILNTLLDGGRLCPYLHMCSSGAMLPIKATESVSWGCRACVDFVAVLKRDLVNVTVQEAVQMIQEKVCSGMSFFIRGTCNSKIDEVLSRFYSDVTSSMSPREICDKNSACVNTMKDKSLSLKANMNGVECEACEVVVEELKKVLLSKDGEIVVKNFLKTRVCRHFGTHSDECVAIVDKYADILIAYINSNLSNAEICELLGVCSEMVKGSKPTTKAAVALECEGCKMLLTHIKQLLADPGRQAALKNFMRSFVCPAIFKKPEQLAKCQLDVDIYFTLMIDTIISELDVDTLCKLLKFCPTSIGVPKVITCDVCEVLVKDAILVITSNSSQHQIMLFLDNEVCPHLRVVKADCVAVVKTYVPRLLAIARESLSSRLLCVRLHLCTLVNKQRLKALISTAQNESVRCELCRLSITEARTLLADKVVLAELEGFLTGVFCLGEHTQTCRELVAEFLPIVANLLLSPSLCSSLHLCDPRPGSASVSPGAIECEICPKFYKAFKNIREDSSLNEILLEFIAVCAEYRGEVQMKCLNHLNNVSFLFESYKKTRSEADFCEMSKLCLSSSSSAVWHANQCHSGPGFWCLSRGHAEFCGIGAVRHCEAHKWKRGAPAA